MSLRSTPDQSRYAAMIPGKPESIHNNQQTYWIKLFGDFSMAYSIVSNSALSHYYSETLGMVGYTDFDNLRLMIGDPLSPKNCSYYLLKEFEDSAFYDGKHTVSVQCGPDTARTFKSLGYGVQYMGYETLIHLPRYSTAGKRKTRVRRWINTARNAGVTVQEVNTEDAFATMKKISDSWLMTKKSTWELSLMTRPPIFRMEQDVRIFCAYRDGMMIGFIIFDPIYSDGKVDGYYADICRNLPDAPNGTTDIIIEEARLCFINEGIRTLSLGVSPLAGMNHHTEYRTAVLSLLLKSNYYFGNRLYSFKGLEFHKSGYHDGDQSELRPVFYAVKGLIPVFKLLKTFNHIGIIQGNSIPGNLAYLFRNLAHDGIGQLTGKTVRLLKRIKGVLYDYSAN